MFFNAVISISKNSLKSCVNDRGLIFTDFVLGTTVPFATQFLIWSFVFSISDVNGYTFNSLIFYYAFVIALGRLNNGYDIVYHLSDQITTGSLDSYLTRPTSYPLFRLYDWFGASLLYVIPFILVLACQVVIVGINDTPILSSVDYFFFYCLLFLMSLTLSFLISLTLASLCFWLTKSDFVLSFLLAFQVFLGGILLPPDLWPETIQWIMIWNPFRFTLAILAELAVEGDMQDLITAIAVTALWILVFIALVSLVWKKGVKGYENSGG